MPSTPRFQHLSTDSNATSFNGHGNGSAPLPYNSKDQLGPPTVQAHYGKALSPLNGGGVRYEAVSGAGLQSDTRGLSDQENGGRASTSQLQVESAQNRVKMEEGEENKRLATALRSLDQLFTTCFKTGRTRAWEKSRKIEESDWMLTKEELNEQLRPEEEGLIPLNAIAGRVVLYGWQLFANQVEINASLSPLKRRKRIYDDAHEARKQLIKLLVLVQWSKVAPELKVARSLIAFINDHFVQTDASVTSLAETRDILTNARLRNYDLVTAIEVLGTGTPQRLPHLLKDAIQLHKPYVDEEAIAIVKDLDESIRLRLACEEILPLPMMSYTIADGRASFFVPTLFEADLTLSGSTLEDRWWLLRVKFDFKVTGDGVDRFPRQPKKSQRSNLLAAADAELAPRSVAAVPEQGLAGKVGQDDEVDRAARGGGGGGEESEDIEMRDAGSLLALDADGAPSIRKDAPLLRLYNLLQSQALQYRLDILHYQAMQQVKLSWGRHLSVRMESSRLPRTLYITYWQRADSNVSGATAAPSTDTDVWRPTASASLAISVQENVKESGTEAILKRLSTTSDRDDSEHGRGQIPERLQVLVQWSIRGPAADFLDSKVVSIDAQDLNAEKLLLDVTSRHSEAAIKAIKSRIANSSLNRLLRIRDCSRVTAKGFKEQFIQLTLSDKVTIALHVDQMSGNIRLEEASDVINSGTMFNSTLTGRDWLKRLREASSKLNEKPDQIIYVLQSLRTKVILEDLEEKSALLGLTITTRMPLRQSDYSKLHSKPGSLMYIALVQCPGYYLVIQIGDDAIQVALMCAGTFLEDLITSMRIVSLEWLDWQRVVDTSSNTIPSTLGKRKLDEIGASSNHTLNISKENLAKLHSYSVALICYHKVEEQLRASGLSFVHVGGWTNLQPPPLESDPTEANFISRIIPSLCLNASTLLGSTNQTVTKRNVSIRLHTWWDPSKAHVAFSIKLKLKKDLVTKEKILETNQEKILYDVDSGTLTFLIQNIDNCLAVFISSWKHIEKVLELALQVLSMEKAGFFTLQEFDLIKVRFGYAGNLIGELRWVQDLTKQRGGYYDLNLEGQGERRNPHQVMKSTLVEWLNRENDSSTHFWPRFMEILQQMLPILDHVYTFPDDCCESAECPELQFQHATRFRLIFMEEYVLDVQLVKDDEFSLYNTAHPNESLTFPTIPNFKTILLELSSDCMQQSYNQSKGEQDSKSSIPTLLCFPNGLLCSNNQQTIHWLLPRLIERIQKELE